jgi:ABC-type amino acid transport substrate-binding protein
MSISLILVTAFTAFVTAKLAVAEFGRVNGPASLGNVIVGTPEGAAVGEYLRQQRIHHRVYSTMSKALQGLRDGEVGAVVYGAKILDYYVQRETQKDLELLPTTFDQQNLALPLPDGSPLRDPLNAALRRYLAQTAWHDLQDRYFAVTSDVGHVDR